MSSAAELAQQIMTAWNLMAEKAGLPNVHSMTSERMRHVKARSQDKFWLENWRAAIERVPASPFRLGQNDRQWLANIDWFLRPNSVTKIIEEPLPPRKTKPAPQSADDTFLARCRSIKRCHPDWVNERIHEAAVAELEQERRAQQAKRRAPGEITPIADVLGKQTEELNND